MTETVLHQWAMSPFCNKIRRCLNYKQLAFSTVDYNGLLALKAASLSPAGQLPVLDHSGQRLQDSSVIARFLDQQQPKPVLYPEDRESLATARFWEDWAGRSLYFYEIYFRMLDPVSMERALDLVCKGRPAWERMVLKLVFKHRYPKKLKQQGLARMAAQDVESEFFGLLSDLDVLLASRQWLAGDALSMADISVVCQIDELVRTSDLAPRVMAYPHLKAWFDRCNAAAPA